MSILAPAASYATFIGCSTENDPLQFFKACRAEAEAEMAQPDGCTARPTCQPLVPTHPPGSQPRCRISTHITEGGLLTTIYRYGPPMPLTDLRFPQLSNLPPLTSRRHNPPRGLRPPPRTSVPQLPSLSSREPAEQHWSCHLHPTSPVAPSHRHSAWGARGARTARRVHSPTSSVLSPSPAALATQESIDLQLPPSFPAYSQYSGTFFSPDYFNSTHSIRGEDARTDTIQLSTSTLQQQVQAELAAARSITDVHGCDVATSGTDWCVELQLVPTPRRRSDGVSPRGPPSAPSTLPRVDEHEAAGGGEPPRPHVMRRLDFENPSGAAARLLEAKGLTAGALEAAVAGAREPGVGKAGHPEVPPLFPETRRFTSYLQQLRDKRPSLEARTAVSSTATITPRDTARSRAPVAAAAAAAAAPPPLLREADAGADESDCSRSVELPRHVGADRAAPAAGPAMWLQPRRRGTACGDDNNDDDEPGVQASQFCSASSLEDDTSDVDAITTRTVSEQSWQVPAKAMLPRRSPGGPPPLMHEPRMLWRRGGAVAR